MNNSQFSIRHLKKEDTERVKRYSFSSESTEVWKPFLCTSESESSYSDSDESVAQVWLSFDRSIENGLSFSDTNEQPTHSYVALISRAILSTPNKKMLLNDIYQYIMDTFPFYNNNEKAWRNSIRHNLSINECFVKIGRSDKGKGNYWSIRSVCLEYFAKGDYRRRNTRQRARKTSVKAADYPSYEFCTRNSYEYVPMTLSQTGFCPYYVKGSLTHTNPQNRHHNKLISQSPLSTFGMTKKQLPVVMHSFGSDSLFPVSQSSSERVSFNSQSTYHTTASLRPSFKSAFYSSCQMHEDNFV